MEPTTTKPAEEPIKKPVEVPQAVLGPKEPTVTATIVKWATHYGVSAEKLLRVAKCESTFRPDTVNGSYFAPDGSTPTGLFQFVRSTYTANAARIGLPAQDDRLNADKSAQVAAWMFSIGQSAQWECKG